MDCLNLVAINITCFLLINIVAITKRLFWGCILLAVAIVERWGGFNKSKCTKQ